MYLACKVPSETTKCLSLDLPLPHSLPMLSGSLIFPELSLGHLLSLLNK